MISKSVRIAGPAIRVAFSVGALIGASSMLATAAFAQQAQPAAPAAAPAKPKPAATKPAAPAAGAPAAAAPAAPAAQPDGGLAAGQPNPWVKYCTRDNEKRKVCLAAQELRSDQGQLIASVALRDIEGDQKKTVLIAVPPVVLIQPGLRLGIDTGKQKEAKYTICFPNACYAELVVNDQFIQTMKKGQALKVTALNYQGKPLPLGFQLAGFKVAQESEGIDPTAKQESQEQLQQELQKRAEQAAEKLGGAAAPKP